MAKSRTDIISDATAKARREWEQYMRLRDRAIYDAFRARADELTAKLAQFEREGKVPPAALSRMDAEVKEMIPVLRRGLSTAVKTAIGRSVDSSFAATILALDAAKIAQRVKIQIGTSFIDQAGKVIRYDITQQSFAQSAWKRYHDRAVKATLAWKPDGIAFSERVWEITHQSQKDILSAIHRGVAEGRSAARISRDIRHLLAVPDTFRGAALRDYHPGRGIYKSAYKNALRLARTETNRAYAEATLAYARSRDWIDTVIWRRGSVIECASLICDQLQDKEYPKDNAPDMPAHPNCLPGDVLVRPAGNIRGATVREYDGELVVLKTASGKQLACTPNHPIFTRGGWVAAGSIQVGQDVAGGFGIDGMLAEGDNIQMPARIEDIASTFAESPGVTTRPMEVSAPDFHGDGVGSEIAIISSYGLLGSELSAQPRQQALEATFFWRYVGRPILDRMRMAASGLPRPFLAPYGILSGASPIGLTLGGPAVGAELLRLIEAANVDPATYEPIPDCGPADGESLGESQDGVPELIPGYNHIDGKPDPVLHGRLMASGPVFDRVVSVHNHSFRGKVYNLETTESYYMANGLATHNCLCRWEVHIEGEPPPDKRPPYITQAQLRKSTRTKKAAAKRRKPKPKG